MVSRESKGTVVNFDSVHTPQGVHDRELMALEQACPPPSTHSAQCSVQRTAHSAQHKVHSLAVTSKVQDSRIGNVVHRS